MAHGPGGADAVANVSPHTVLYAKQLANEANFAPTEALPTAKRAHDVSNSYALSSDAPLTSRPIVVLEPSRGWRFAGAWQPEEEVEDGARESRVGRKAAPAHSAHPLT